MRLASKRFTNIAIGGNCVRKFELVGRFKGEEDLLPKRSTKRSAGYDFRCAEDTVVPSMLNGVVKPKLVSTGLKAYMGEDEVLNIYNRSSSPSKKGLIVSNGVGVVDSDYVDNPDNEGEIFVQYYNYGEEDVLIKRGERIAQGVFMKYLVVDDEEEVVGDRLGGHGSTGIE